MSSLSTIAGLALAVLGFVCLLYLVGFVGAYWQSLENKKKDLKSKKIKEYARFYLALSLLAGWVLTLIGGVLL